MRRTVDAYLDTLPPFARALAEIAFNVDYERAQGGSTALVVPQLDYCPAATAVDADAKSRRARTVHLRDYGFNATALGFYTVPQRFTFKPPDQNAALAKARAVQLQPGADFPMLTAPKGCPGKLKVNVVFFFFFVNNFFSHCSYC